MLFKCCTQYASTFGKLSSGHRTGKGVFIPVPKKGNAKECSNHSKIALVSHASKEILKILQARIQRYMNCQLPNVQARFLKAEEPGIKLPIALRLEKKQEFQENIYICLIDYTKDFDCVDQNKLWKILKEIGIPDHLTCLLRNLYAG